MWKLITDIFNFIGAVVGYILLLLSPLVLTVVYMPLLIYFLVSPINKYFFLMILSFGLIPPLIIMGILVKDFYWKIIPLICCLLLSAATLYYYRGQLFDPLSSYIWFFSIWTVLALVIIFLLFLPINLFCAKSFCGINRFVTVFFSILSILVMFAIVYKEKTRFAKNNPSKLETVKTSSLLGISADIKSEIYWRSFVFLAPDTVKLDNNKYVFHLLPVYENKFIHLTYEINGDVKDLNEAVAEMKLISFYNPMKSGATGVLFWSQASLEGLWNMACHPIMTVQSLWKLFLSIFQNSPRTTFNNTKNAVGDSVNAHFSDIDKKLLIDNDIDANNMKLAEDIHVLLFTHRSNVFATEIACELATFIIPIAYAKRVSNAAELAKLAPKVASAAKKANMIAAAVDVAETAPKIASTAKKVEMLASTVKKVDKIDSVREVASGSSKALTESKVLTSSTLERKIGAETGEIAKANTEIIGKTDDLKLVTKIDDRLPSSALERKTAANADDLKNVTSKADDIPENAKVKTDKIDNVNEKKTVNTELNDDTAGGKSMSKYTGRYKHMEPEINEYTEKNYGGKFPLEPHGSKDADIIIKGKDGKIRPGEIKHDKELKRDLNSTFYRDWNNPEYKVGGKEIGEKISDIYSDKCASLSSTQKGYLAVIDGQTRGYVTKHMSKDGICILEKSSDKLDDITKTLEYLKKEGRVADYKIDINSNGTVFIPILYK